jgi:hypothetical protein
VPILVIAAIPDMPGANTELIRAMWGTFYKTAPSANVVYFEATREFVTEDAPTELDRAVDQFIKGEKVEGRARPEPKPGETPAGPATAPPPPPAQPSPAPQPPTQPEAPRR